MATMGDRSECACGRPVRSKGLSVGGKRLWDRVCQSCKSNTYTRHKKHYCESCGFIAIHRVQLDVDHIDGNHLNNDVSNLMTLCANCHRLKTHINNDHAPIRGIRTITIKVHDELELDLGE